MPLDESVQVCVRSAWTEIARYVGTIASKIKRWLVSMTRPDARYLMAVQELAHDLGVGYFSTHRESSLVASAYNAEGPQFEEPFSRLRWP